MVSSGATPSEGGAHPPIAHPACRQRIFRLTSTVDGQVRSQLCRNGGLLWALSKRDGRR